MKTYHVRIYYRTPNKSGRRLSWIPTIKAESAEEAGRRAIERVTSRKPNSGQVEVVLLDVREKEQTNA